MVPIGVKTQPLHAQWKLCHLISWWRHQMETFSRHWPFVRGIHRSPVNSPHRGPVTRSFNVSFDLPMKKRLSKQWWGWWFETPSCPLWRHWMSSWILHCLDRQYWPDTVYFLDIAIIQSHTSILWTAVMWIYVFQLCKGRQCLSRISLSANIFL